MSAFEFEYNNANGGVAAMECAVGISTPGEKMSTSSYITFRTDQMSGYEMTVELRQHGGKEEETIEIGALGEITITILGSYESHDLIRFLQRAGALSKLVYPQSDG